MREAKRAKLLVASAPQPAAKVLLIAFMTMFCILNLKWALGIEREHSYSGKQVENAVKVYKSHRRILMNLTFNPLNICPWNFSTVTDKRKNFCHFFSLFTHFILTEI